MGGLISLQFMDRPSEADGGSPLPWNLHQHFFQDSSPSTMKVSAGTKAAVGRAAAVSPATPGAAAHLLGVSPKPVPGWFFQPSWHVATREVFGSVLMTVGLSLFFLRETVTRPPHTAARFSHHLDTRFRSHRPARGPWHWLLPQPQATRCFMTFHSCFSVS